MTLVREHERAIELRKEGKTYSEILDILSVSRSTLSLWLREVGLSRQQIQRISKKKRDAQKRGAQKRHTDRVATQKKIYTDAMIEVGQISERELWLIGISLYWAEGSKEKEYKSGSNLIFSNSDPRMIAVYLAWLTRVLGIGEGRILFELYVHQNRRKDVKMFQDFWASELGYPVRRFEKVYFKKGNPKTKRKNTGGLYRGLVRVKVGASSTIVRKVEGWVRGMTKHCGIV